jgi:hypothetical protein
LYKSDGTLLAQGFDEDTFDPGSVPSGGGVETFDSFITYNNFPSAGTYYLAVGRCCNPILSVPPGVDYQLHVSIHIDTTPPQLTLPSDLTVYATETGGARVNFNATATDDEDGEVPVICNPASGDLFAIGTTQVKCSATDNSDNLAEGSFNVTVLQDTTPPEVSSTSPLNNATGVTATATISASFLEDGSGIDSGTFTDKTFKVVQVKPTGDVTVSGDLSFDEDSQKVTFTPSSSLAKGAYRVTITTGVEDKAGNQLAKDYTWQFATVGPKK